MKEQDRIFQIKRISCNSDTEAMQENIKIVHTVTCKIIQYMDMTLHLCLPLQKGKLNGRKVTR